MVKLDIYGGLLGAGKTTLIRKMLSTAYAGHKTAIIENEVGKVNLDAEMLNAASVSVREIASGCICCTLKGNFTEAIRRLTKQEQPEYIIVEPSGVADLESVVSACLDAEGIELNRVILVVNAARQTKLLKIAGEFYRKQLRIARNLYLNFTEKMTPEEVVEARKSLWEINPDLVMIETPLAEITADTFPEGQVSERIFDGRNACDPAVSDAGKTGMIHMRTKGRQPSLSVWCFRFQKNFREDEAERLLAVFEQEACAEIWRVKGYLKMEDGSIRKMDVVFGDHFQEEVEGISESKLNQLVFIGRKLNLLWLREQMERIQADV